MNKHLKYLAVSLIGLLFTSGANAILINGAVTAGTGSYVKLGVPLGNPFGAPNSVGNNTFQDPNLYGFDESQNTKVLNSALAFDVGVNGSIGSGTAGPSNGGTIAVDTVVASHYVFFDPGPGTRMAGWVEFDSNILGVITSTGTLAASDYLANTGVNYLNPGLRGLELNSDAIVSVEARKVFMNFFAATPGDYIRVLTEFSPGAAPEPASIALFGLGLVGLGFSRRKKI